MISIIDNKYSQLIDNIKTPMENYINEMKEDNGAGVSLFLFILIIHNFY